jgi:hypothetical protein
MTTSGWVQGKMEDYAAKYGLRAIDFIEASEWVKEYPLAYLDYCRDAVTAATIAAHYAFAAHPEWRKE